MSNKVIGKLSDFALTPFYRNIDLFSSCVSFPVKSSVLFQLILKGKISAGPVSALSWIELKKNGCSSLSDFGLFVNPYITESVLPCDPISNLAALSHAPYILLTRKPLDEHENICLGVDPDIVSSGLEVVLMAKLLLSTRWEVEHEINCELNLSDDAWLVQGGPYFPARTEHFFGFRYAYDMLGEWYRWKKIPFMLYRWAVSPGVGEEEREELVCALRRTLELNLRDLANIAGREASHHDLDRSNMLSYLKIFGHRFGLWNKTVDDSFEQLASLVEDIELPALST
ncbi:MqnA/MqnD/SBP family protein [Elusimicrobiota bacterium]